MLKTALGALATSSTRLALLLLCTSALAQAQPSVPVQGTKIAYLQTERVISGSKLAKAAEEKITDEFSKRQKSIQEQIAAYKSASEKLEAEAPKLSEFDRTKRTRELYDLEKDLQRRQREFNEDLMQRRNEERALIAVKVTKVIEQFATEQHIDVVLDEWAWANPRLDITEEILKRLDK